MSIQRTMHNDISLRWNRSHEHVERVCLTRQRNGPMASNFSLLQNKQGYMHIVREWSRLFPSSSLSLFFGWYRFGYHLSIAPHPLFVFVRLFLCSRKIYVYIYIYRLPICCSMETTEDNQTVQINATHESTWIVSTPLHRSLWSSYSLTSTSSRTHLRLTRIASSWGFAIWTDVSSSTTVLCIHTHRRFFSWALNYLYHGIGISVFVKFVSSPSSCADS